MSGGVDSTVAASLLKRDAHEVVGVTLFLHDTPVAHSNIEQARGVCDKLGIEHHVVDVRDRYNKTIIEPLTLEWGKALEPNVCARCHRDFKMPLLFELMKEHGCRKLATGHYARIVSASDGIGTYPLRLHSALDRSKDQSFMLYNLTQSEMNLLMLPLAEMTKLDVRMHAMRAGLMFPELDLDETPCLFGKGSSCGQWLDEQGLGLPAGNIVALNGGAKLGSHTGLHHFTLGDKVKFDDEADQYVVVKDLLTNNLLVAPQNQAKAESCLVKDVHWTSIHPIEEKRSCRVKFDVRDTARPVQLVPMKDGKLMLSFTIPVAGLASGKTVVFYSDTMVLGGGTII